MVALSVVLKVVQLADQKVGQWVDQKVVQKEFYSVVLSVVQKVRH